MGSLRTADAMSWDGSGFAMDAHEVVIPMTADALPGPVTGCREPPRERRLRASTWRAVWCLRVKERELEGMLFTTAQCGRGQGAARLLSQMKC